MNFVDNHKVLRNIESANKEMFFKKIHVIPSGIKECAVHSVSLDEIQSFLEITIASIEFEAMCICRFCSPKVWEATVSKYS